MQSKTGFTRYFSWILFAVVLSAVAAYVDFKGIQNELNLKAAKELSSVRAAIEQTINRYFTLVHSMEAFALSNMDLYDPESSANLEFGDRFQTYSAALEDSHQAAISLQLAPLGVVSFVSNLERNAKAIGHDLLKDDSRRKQVLQTIIDHTTVVAGPLTLIQGGEAIIARKAIYGEEQRYDPSRIYLSGRASAEQNWPKLIPSDFWGFATLVIDTKKLFSEIGLDDLDPKYDFALRGRHGLGMNGDIFWGLESLFGTSARTEEIRLPGGSWVVAIEPKESASYIRPIIIVVIGIALGLFAALGFYSRREKLEAETEAKTHSRFLATMSHEIRTPMNGIIGVAEVLHKTNLDDKQLDLVDKIRSSSNLLLRLVNDILDFSKIDSGSMQLELEPFDIRKILHSSCGIIEQQAKEKGVVVDLEIADDFPDRANGDAVRFQQVMFNLLSNAIKFTDEGCVKLQAKTCRREDRMYLSISITDSGIGMSKETLARIFNPFTQADQSITRRFGGTGLGLVISEKLVKLMGGQIKVDSQLGVGSTFRVEIPFIESNHGMDKTKKEDSEQLPEEGPHEATNANRGGKPLRILIVDDQQINLEVASLLLEQLGYEATHAFSGQEAIKLASEVTFDIIFMDRHMPGMDGLATTAEIRKISGSGTYPWVIALTASAQKEEKDEYLNAGANDFLSKPVDLASISNSIEAFLKQEN